MPLYPSVPHDMMKILTVFVLLLNTRTFPVDVPTKTYLPDGSNRAVVMMELTSLYQRRSQNRNEVAYRARSSSPSLKPSHSSTLALCSLRESTTYASPVLSNASVIRLRSPLSSTYDKRTKNRCAPISWVKICADNRCIKSYCGVTLGRVRWRSEIPDDYVPIFG
jgi:hypothetical protein